MAAAWFIPQHEGGIVRRFLRLWKFEFCVVPETISIIVRSTGNKGFSLGFDKRSTQDLKLATARTRIPSLSPLSPHQQHF